MEQGILVDFKSLAKKLLKDSQELQLDWNGEGQIEFTLNDATLEMLIETTDARLIENLGAIWHEFLKQLNNKFEKVLLEFVKKNRSNFN